MVPQSCRYRLKRHEQTCHRDQLAMAENINRRKGGVSRQPEVNIPATPTFKKESPCPVRNRPSRPVSTVTRPSISNTPLVTCTKMPSPISPLSEISPCSISLGIEDHGPVTPVKKDLMSIFEARPVQEADNSETDSGAAINTSNNSDKRQVVRSSEHLQLPVVGSVDGDRFSAPPSFYQTSYDASRVLAIRMKAKSSASYHGSVHPFGYSAVKMDERAILPDGTIYHLSAVWIPDPMMSQQHSQETQTEQELTTSATQTADRRVILISSDTNTDNATYSHMAVQVNGECQCKKTIQTT